MILSNTAPRGVRGLGDASGCGTNPCDVWDDIWVSDACSAYLACAGLPAMTFSAQLGAGLQEITSGIASAVGSGVEGSLSDYTTDIVLIGAAVVALWVLKQ